MVPTQLSLVTRLNALAVGLAGYGLLAGGLILYRLPLPEIGYLVLLILLGITLSTIHATLPTGIEVSLEATVYYAAMLTLGPWAAGLVSIWLIYRWGFSHRDQTLWAVLHNSGMYALMTIAGGLVYAAIGTVPLGAITPLNLLALLLALVTVRIVNELILFWRNMLAGGVRAALTEFQEVQQAAWLVEVLAYLPAVLTAAIYEAIGWDGLVLWLLVLLAAAFALYGLVRARAEVTGRFTELSVANTRMTAQGELETALAARLGTASTELASYASRLASVLLDQHTAVTQITSTVEELAQQARYIADAAGAVDSTSEAALVTAGRGQEAAAGSVQAMGDLERNVHEMNTRMSTLESRSRLIHRTLQTINNIAGETHLLALNATIEAAGAGEQGRRFSVVAQQINALADQALRAAGEIQVTVREIEEATSATKGVVERGLVETRRYTGQVDEARRSMEVILGAVGRASEMAQQIRLATQQQTQASSQVTDAMREITTSMGTATTEGAAVYSAAEQLRRMAEELRILDEAVGVSVPI
ncbi:MAG TPA: methyl-accepting chemotaxis protein [Chloroflexia bacterium]|nr:methyl-accepting chemotaxis protein [Chloroflexia bacterium]